MESDGNEEDWVVMYKPSFSEQLGMQFQDTGDKPMKRFKVCLSGQKGVGKTSIFNNLRVRGKEFRGQPKAELNIWPYVVEIKGTSVRLVVEDTAGMEEYNSLTENYYRSAHAIIQIYDVTDKESFLHISNNVQNISSQNYAPDSKFILVGNKIDKPMTDSSVSEELAGNFFANFETVRFAAFMKTSAKTGVGVKELFREIASILVASNATPVERKDTRTLFEEHYDKKKAGCCS